MMDKDIYNWKFFHAIFKKGETIPISSLGFKDAFKEAHARLKKGHIVGIFPEGKISTDGELGEFKKGYELIANDFDGVIVPFYIGNGIFGSSFSKYKPKNAKIHLFKRRVINIYFGKPAKTMVPSDELKETILKMRKKYEAQ
jgi:acyl-[acyl-carrier-protein]-phospholipid O-acyltransferase/long-chain-fatty-acid--[acyl-carrier-protein] ligase